MNYGKQAYTSPELEWIAADGEVFTSVAIKDFEQHEGDVCDWNIFF